MIVLKQVEEYDFQKTKGTLIRITFPGHIYVYAIDFVSQRFFLSHSFWSWEDLGEGLFKHCSSDCIAVDKEVPFTVSQDVEFFGEKWDIYPTFRFTYEGEEYSLTSNRRCESEGKHWYVVFYGDWYPVALDVPMVLSPKGELGFTINVKGTLIQSWQPWADAGKGYEVYLGQCEILSKVQKMAEPLPFLQEIEKQFPAFFQEGPKTAVKKKAALIAQLSPVQQYMLRLMYSDKSEKKLSNNQLLAAFLSTVQTVDDFQPLWAPVEKWKSPLRDLLYNLPGTEEIKIKKEEKQNWHKRKDASVQAAALGVTEELYPNLYAALLDSSIKASVFHEPWNPNCPVNQEFGLLEMALANPEWKDHIISILSTASGRTTYTKQVSSYLAFLFKLPLYLQKHAPREGGWKAQPVLVESTWQLEMEEADAEGTTKKRSAMTPVVDNTTGIVTIPYVSIYHDGAYCYSHRYFVQEQYACDPISNGVYTRELAVKLNGRDDYGLCFYTLTGTDVARGYPTFLVIFERLGSGQTRVHFHRVRPNRFKNGAPVLPDLLIEACYQYMAGNVPAGDISYQQGDLLLIREKEVPKASEEPFPIERVDNHSFVSSDPLQPVHLALTKAKGNTVGWLTCNVSFSMPHPEHEGIVDIPAGCYRLSRCKSFEANPLGIQRARYVD